MGPGITLLSNKLATPAFGILQGARLSYCQASRWIFISRAGLSESLQLPLGTPVLSHPLSSYPNQLHLGLRTSHVLQLPQRLGWGSFLQPHFYSSVKSQPSSGVAELVPLTLF